MKKTKKRNKYTKPIISVCCIAMIVVVLLSNSVIAFADSGAVSSEGYLFDDNKYILYDRGEYNHGLGFDVIYYGMNYNPRTSNDYNAMKYGFNYTLNNVGRTIKDVSPNTSNYPFDQIPRIELVDVTPDTIGKDNSMPFLFGDYVTHSYPGMSADIDNSYLTYSYGTATVGNEISQYLVGENIDLSQVEEYIYDLIPQDGLVNTRSGVASSVEYRYKGQLSVSLLRDAYFPDEFAVYCLSPLSVQKRDALYRIRLSGYNSDSGYLEYLDVDVSEGLGDFVDVIYNENMTYDNKFNLNFLNSVYDFCYGCETYNVVLNGEAIQYLCEENDIDVLTDISIVMGLDIATDNRQFRDYYDEWGSYPVYGTEIFYYGVAPDTQNHHNQSVINYLRSTSGSELPNANVTLLSWLGNTIGGVMDVDLFGTFGLGDIMYITVGLGIFIAFLKIFVGG